MATLFYLIIIGLFYIGITYKAYSFGVSLVIITMLVTRWFLN
jgi:hypothetical protein